MPGESVAKDPTINNVSTKNPAFVFMKVEIPCSNIIATDDPDDEETPVELFTYSVTDGSGWTELTSAKVADMYKYNNYKGKLPALEKNINNAVESKRPEMVFFDIMIIEADR